MTVHQVPYPTAPPTWSSRTYTAGQDSSPNHLYTATCSPLHHHQTTSLSAQHSWQLQLLHPAIHLVDLEHPPSPIPRPPNPSVPNLSTSRQLLKKGHALAPPALPPSLAAPPLAAYTTTASATTPRGLAYSGKPPLAARTPTAMIRTLTSTPRSSIRWIRAPPANTAPLKNPALRTITPLIPAATGSGGAAAPRVGRGDNITA